VRTRPDLATAAVVEAAALRIRKELAEDGWDHGPLSVRARMLQEGLPVPSRATLARIFVRRGAVVPQPQKRPRSSWRRFTFARVHECWQLDATEVVLGTGGKAVVFQLMDDHSRFIVASIVAVSENSAAAVAVLQTAVAAHQAPVLLLSDNGLAMNPHRRGRTSQLAAYAASLGIHAITSRPYHPQTCGKNERVHSTLKRWLRARVAPADIDELTTWVKTFDEQYNHRRPHQALAMRTPAQAFTDGPKAIPPQPQPTGTHNETLSVPRRRTPPPKRPARFITQPDWRAHSTEPSPDTGQVSVLRVAATGNVKAGGCFIQLGKEHAGSEVLAMVEPPVITIFNV
jgi:transposase InsO family protein